MFVDEHQHKAEVSVRLGSGCSGRPVLEWRTESNSGLTLLLADAQEGEAKLTASKGKKTRRGFSAKD